MRRFVNNCGSKPLIVCLVAVGIFLIPEASLQPGFSEQSVAPLSTARIHEIARMLVERPSGFGSPCSDRAAWSARAAELRRLVGEARRVIETPLPPFDKQAYLQFTRTGDRQPMERNLHSRMDQLVPVVLAECAEYEGRFLPRIAEVMNSLASMPSWTLSAHDPELLNLRGIRYYVDLNAADMADNLAEALYLLGDRIPAATRKHVMNEMERHVFGPMRQSFEHGNRVEERNGNWWLYADMNWNAVCLKGVTGAALAVLTDVEDRALFVAAAEHYIQHYEDSFNPDGYDTEGLGYWNYGFSHFIELRENVLRATGGRIDLIASPKMQKVALFGIQFPMMPNNAAAFGDAEVMPVPDPHLIRMIDHIFQIPQGSRVPYEKNLGVQGVGLTSIALDLFPVSGDELPTPPELSHHDLQTYYADSGVLVSRPAPGQDLAITIKAGGNTTHSHNDIGSFVIGLDGVQPVGDPGGPRYYTKATFGPHRLDSRLLNSFGHPVPEIGGLLQLDATKVKVNVPSHTFEPERDSITIDMTPAYDTAALRSLTRTMVHSRMGKGSIDITDEFDLEQPTEIIESLPTHGSWKKIDDRTLLFTQNGKRLKVVIDAPGHISVNDTRVDDYGNSFTRVAVHIPVQGHESVTLHFAAIK
jgi:hypothetical protein